MLKRSLIRTIFLLPLLLCLLGWACSITHAYIVGYRGNRHAISCMTSSGSISLAWNNPSPEYRSRGWEWRRLRHYNHIFPPKTSFDDVYCLGFAIGSIKPDSPLLTSDSRWIQIPYYFPLLLSSLALFYIYRQIRPTSSPATAFPVETSRSKP